MPRGVYTLAGLLVSWGYYADLLDTARLEQVFNPASNRSVSCDTRAPPRVLVGSQHPGEPNIGVPTIVPSSEPSSEPNSGPNIEPNLEPTIG